jgi:hypothetical protein
MLTYIWEIQTESELLSEPNWLVIFRSRSTRVELVLPRGPRVFQKETDGLRQLKPNKTKKLYKTPQKKWIFSPQEIVLKTFSKWKYLLIGDSMEWILIFISCFLRYLHYSKCILINLLNTYYNHKCNFKAKDAHLNGTTIIFILALEI